MNFEDHEAKHIAFLWYKYWNPHKTADLLDARAVTPSTVPRCVSSSEIHITQLTVVRQDLLFVNIHKSSARRATLS